MYAIIVGRGVPAPQASPRLRLQVAVRRMASPTVTKYGSGKRDPYYFEPEVTEPIQNVKPRVKRKLQVEAALENSSFRQFCDHTTLSLIHRNANGDFELLIMLDCHWKF